MQYISYFSGFQPLEPSHPTFSSLQNNTYQAIVITDGLQSFVIYTYECGLMEWSGFGAYPTIGFNAFGDYYDNHPLTGQPAANDIACFNQTRWNNVVYSLTRSVGEEQEQRAECRKRYFEDIQLFGNISSIAAALEPCPCFIFQAQLDSRFRLHNEFLDNRSMCYFQRFPPTTDYASQYCCYSVE